MTRRNSSIRFPVAKSDAQATLVLGRRRIPAQLLEVSIDGFVVTVKKSYLNRMQFDRPWKMVSGSEQCLIAGELLEGGTRSLARLFLHRLHDVTPEPTIKRSWLPSRCRNTLGVSAAPEVMLCVMLSVIVGMFALPGVGDRLGTAKIIRTVIHSAISFVTQG